MVRSSRLGLRFNSVLGLSGPLLLRICGWPEVVGEEMPLCVQYQCRRTYQVRLLVRILSSPYSWGRDDTCRAVAFVCMMLVLLDTSAS
jgi:hypothetical protein